MTTTGEVINGYKVVKEINQGNFCDAYKVQKGSEYFFMKKYSDPMPSNEEYRAFVVHQEKMISRLRLLGNNIEDIIEHFEKRFYFQIKRFIDGENLENWLYNPSNTNFETRKAFAIMICDALDVIHKVGIIHADLKPAQFMVVRDVRHSCGYRLILTDFDWSIIDGKRLKAVNTPNYGCLDKTISDKSDIFTFGIILSELLTGVHPYAHNPSAAGLTPRLWENWILNKRYMQLREINSAISKEINDIVVQCLDPRPENRPSIDRIKASLTTPIDSAPTARKYDGIYLNATGGQLLIPVDGSAKANAFRSMFPSLKDSDGNPIHRYFETNADVLIVGYKDHQVTLSTHIVKNKLIVNGIALSITPVAVNNGATMELYSSTQNKVVAKFLVKLRDIKKST